MSTLISSFAENSMYYIFCRNIIGMCVCVPSGWNSARNPMFWLVYIYFLVLGLNLQLTPGTHFVSPIIRRADFWWQHCDFLSSYNSSSNSTGFEANLFQWVRLPRQLAHATWLPHLPELVDSQSHHNTLNTFGWAVIVELFSYELTSNCRRQEEAGGGCPCAFCAGLPVEMCEDTEGKLHKGERNTPVPLLWGPKRDCRAW